MMEVKPILVDQQTAAEMLGVSVTTFARLRREHPLLAPAVIPSLKSRDGRSERYLVSDLAEWAKSLKYPCEVKRGGMWRRDKGAA